MDYNNYMASTLGLVASEVDNEVQRQRCEAERELEKTDIEANDDFDNPQFLIDRADEYWENQYDAHKENCAGCALCEPDL